MYATLKQAFDLTTSEFEEEKTSLEKLFWQRKREGSNSERGLSIGNASKKMKNKVKSPSAFITKKKRLEN